MAKARSGTGEILPWERQIGESEAAFEAFTFYRNQEGRRSVRKGAQSFSKSYTLLRKWSAKNNWVERCRAWDNEQLRLQQEQARQEEKIARNRQRKIGETMQAKALQWMNAVKPEEMDGNVAVKMMQLGIQLENAAISRTLEEFMVQTETTDNFLANLVKALAEGRAAAKQGVSDASR